MKRELDIVVISDVHLGTYSCHAKELLEYLKNIKVKTLILNGDFIDIWQFKKTYFPKEHMQVIQRILKMAANGTKVYYITGNHDDALRRYSDFSSGNIHLRDKLVLQLRGRKYLFFHGDVFDLFFKYSSLVSKLGGKGYDWLILANRFVNNVRVMMGKPRMSFAKRIKYSMKGAVRFVNEFEETALQMAADQGYDYVVCGHIHRPQMRTLERPDQQRTIYLNSGDWVESLTALEYKWGRWSIYEYDEADYANVHPQLRIEETGTLLEDEEDMGATYALEDVFEQIVQRPNPRRKRSAM